MVLAVAFDDVKTKRIRREGDGKETTGGILSTRFFGSRDNPDLPFAGLSEQDPGRYSVPHFHIVDQFQIIIDGKGKLGRHALSPYSVHFSRAFTPYGPLTSDPAVPMTFFVLRAHPDPGSQALAEFGYKLKNVPDRQPWQITSQATFPTLRSDAAAADAMLQMVPRVQDDQGLAAYTLSMKPNARTVAPDPTFGDGQYLVVVKGSLWHDDKEHQAPALVFVYPKEHAFQVHAGTAGLQALVLNFPRPRTSTKREERGRHPSA